MARGGVNKAVVQTARLAILARGEHPSIDAVRIEMGNTGSKTTIHRYLKELDDGDLRRVAPVESLDEELGELVSRLAQRLQEQAREPVEQALAQLAAEKAEWQAQLAEMARQLEQQQRQFEIQGVALANESSNLLATRSMLQTEQTRNAGLSQACSDYELRLKDKDQQIRSLEDKHLHAREALEHFRSATRDQRDQEQRRHETQVQQVQMELRQAQQSALVRQDEITQLHRDNERLLAESRNTSKALKLAQEQQEKERLRAEQQTQHARTLENSSTLLQERLRVVLEDSESLKLATTNQQERLHALELKLAETETALKALDTSL
ncbi:MULTISPECIES: DNA-binding protein [Pseudomonas]|uniref:DNA-binding protein n=1 Tax=Pseudomonas gingeri TaxID=117681 RepID=A0A7Y7WJ03_9PSED|nr:MULTISPECIES: DNA-binding protein [Pseudomonas]MCU1742104.1 DNA-binding protein [Pseudomonas sp. 20S_6.2_Bac1]NWB50350.1 DNA-binding protein [Pseudomonas gingeri]